VKGSAITTGSPLYVAEVVVPRVPYVLTVTHSVLRTTSRTTLAYIFDFRKGRTLFGDLPNWSQSTSSTVLCTVMLQSQLTALLRRRFKTRQGGSAMEVFVEKCTMCYKKSLTTRSLTRPVHNFPIERAARTRVELLPRQAGHPFKIGLNLRILGTVERRQARQRYKCMHRFLIYR